MQSPDAWELMMVKSVLESKKKLVGYRLGTRVLRLRDLDTRIV